MAPKKINKDSQKKAERMKEMLLGSQLSFNEMHYARHNPDINQPNDSMFTRILRNNQMIANTVVNKSFAELLLRANSFRFIGLFDQCMDDLQLALNYGAPKTIVQQERVRCSLAEEADVPLEKKDFFKLSFKPNRRLPELADCLELRKNHVFGRHIVTTRDLQAGDIVGLSEPFFKAFDRNAVHFRCSHCFKENFMRLLACKNCKNAMYCSEKCETIAQREYHHIECRPLKVLNHRIIMNLSENMPLKMLLQAVRILGSVDRLRTFLEEAPTDVTVFDFDLSDPNSKVYEKNLLLAALSLKNESQNYGIESQLDDFHEVINNRPEFKKMWTCDDGPFLDDLLVKMIKISSLRNSHSYWSSERLTLNAMKMDGEDVYDHNIGYGVDPFAALMNSSCCPNIRLISVDNKNAWVVKHPIRANEQLFRSYGGEFTSEFPSHRRQGYLWHHFGFVCYCRACVMEYPPAQYLKIADEDYVYDDVSNLLDASTAEKIYKKNCDYINKNFHKDFPSKELCYAMAMNVFKLQVLAKPADFYP